MGIKLSSQNGSPGALAAELHYLTTTYARLSDTTLQLLTLHLRMNQSDQSIHFALVHYKRIFADALIRYEISECLFI